MSRETESGFAAEAGHTSRTLAACLGVVAVALLLRWPLADIPLERDEGEYAYIAQRWLQGEVPYSAAFDQKPPGAFAVYAVLFQCFGQSIGAIHWGTQLYTLGTLAMIALLGRRLGGPEAGWAAALLAAFMTTDQCVLGNAANTETFMILPLTAGLAATLYAVERDSIVWAGLAGVCGTLALLCKQVALTNVVWHALLLLVCGRSRWRLVAAYAVGGAASLAPVLGYFQSAGALGQFWDCVIGHNLAYARRIPLSEYPLIFVVQFSTVFRQWWPELFFAGIGLFLRSATNAAPPSHRWLAPRPLLLGWLAASFAGVSIGGYYRQHYFFQIIPPLAVAAGCGAVALARHYAPGRAGIATLALTGAAIMWGVVLEPWYYLMGSPAEKCAWIYGAHPFAESLPVAEFIARRSSPDDTIFVYGSEPQIFFYADRKSASRYIFLYPLMTSFPDTRGRQADTLAELADRPPRFVVAVNTYGSFLYDDDTPPLLRDELEGRLMRDYQMIGTVAEGGRSVNIDPAAISAGRTLPPPGDYLLAIWERRPGR